MRKQVINVDLMTLAWLAERASLRSPEKALAGLHAKNVHALNALCMKQNKGMDKEGGGKEMRM